MEYLHNANIIHRDLKSDNCLVNDELDVKVCDFGTSKFLTAGRSTLQSLPFNVEATGNDSLALSATMTKGVGTILWMAPELFVGGTHYKQEVDMYSYGMIMWELLTRQVPWSEIEYTSYLHFYKALDSAIKNNQRPLIPTELMEAHHDFVVLMQRCWATKPQSRPTFKHVIELLA
jgi:serine/threonine protein kinase